MDTQHERLRRARLQAGFKSAAKAAEALGMPASSYTANENGQNGFGSDRAAIYGKRFGVHPAWLLLGDPFLSPEWDRGMGIKEAGNAFIGKLRPLTTLEVAEAQIESAERSHFEDDEVMQAPDSTRVAIVGYVGAGSEIFPEPSDAGSEVLDEVEIDFPTKKGTAAAIVRGDSMLPVFEDGDLIGYYRDAYTATDMLGRQCVVKLADGRMFLKTVKPGREPGLFTLTSFNARDIEDVAIEWAAPFRFRISRFSWRAV